MPIIRIPNGINFAKVRGAKRCANCFVVKKSHKYKDIRYRPVKSNAAGMSKLVKALCQKMSLNV